MESCGLFELNCWFQVTVLAFADLFHSIPVPSWMTSASGLSLPDSVSWLLNVVNAGFGVSVIIGAYSIRFLIRRFPLVG